MRLGENIGVCVSVYGPATAHQLAAMTCLSPDFVARLRLNNWKPYRLQVRPHDSSRVHLFRYAGVWGVTIQLLVSQQLVGFHDL